MDTLLARLPSTAAQEAATPSPASLIALTLLLILAAGAAALLWRRSAADRRRIAQLEQALGASELKHAEELIAAQRDLARLSSAAPDCDTALAECLAIVLRVTGADSAGIYLLDPERFDLSLVAHRGLSAEFVRAASSYPADASLTQIIRAGEFTYLAEADIQAVSQPRRSTLLAEGLRAVAIIPIKHHEQVLGSLSASSHTNSQIPPHARVALETISAEIGNLLTTLRTQKSLRERDAQLQKLVATLEAEQLRLVTVAATVPGAICSFSLRPNGVLAIPYASASFEDLYGLSRVEVANEAWPLIERIPVDQRDRLYIVVKESARTLQAWREEYEYQHPTRGAIWIEGFAMPVREADEITVWHGIAMDITERKRAERARTQYSEQMSTVAEIEHALAAALSPERIYEVVVDATRRLFPDVAAVFVSRFHEERQSITAVAAYDDGQPVDVSALPELPLAPDGQGTQSRVIRTRQPLIIGSNLRDAFVSSPTLIGESPQLTDSALLVPMIAQESVLGLVQLQSYTPNRFSSEDARLLALVANTAAVAIRNIWLYELAQRELAERRQIETALRASEEQQRSLMKSLASAVATVDARGIYLYLNDVAAQQLNSDPGTLVGRSMYDLFPQHIADAQMAHIRQVIREDCGMVSEAITVVMGAPRWYRTAIHPIHNERGQVACALVNATDIHDLKLAQQDLLDLNQTLEARVSQRTAEVQDLYENAPTGYHSIDADGNITMINETELRWLGYRREEIVGRPMTDFVTPLSAATFNACFPHLKRQGYAHDVEMEMVRKDGSTFPAVLNATAVYDSAGQYLSSRTTVFDITQRKRAEAALLESEAQNRLLFEESPDAVVLVDSEARIVRANRAFAQLLGHSLSQLLGRRIHEIEIVSARDIEQVAEAVITAQRSNQVASVELKIQQSSGSQRDVGVRVFGLLLQGMPHFLASVRDITAAKQAEETLRLANGELARAARAKDQFLANMSHELRTPLNAILGFSESLQEGVHGALTDRQLSRLRSIDTSARHLLSLITDILDLSKIEAGRLTLQIEPVPLGDICQGSLLFVKEAAARKSLALSLQLEDPQTIVRADAKRLKQMLVNLLSNAVKFTPPHGTVGIAVSADTAAGTIALMVHDTGIGIAPADLERLFVPFSQLDSSLSRQHEGSGLGLALVHRLAELHSGSITVTSHVGVGSQFTITLPYRAPLAAEPRQRRDPADGARQAASLARAAQAAPAARILLAEDNEGNIAALEEYLRAKSYHVTITKDGREAIERALALRPDIILMDIQMPEMDGLEATRQLRARQETRETPIIALTALAMPGDRERCLEAGANAYMAKPVSLRGLHELITQLLPSTAAQPSGRT